MNTTEKDSKMSAKAYGGGPIDGSNVREVVEEKEFEGFKIGAINCSRK